jgi:predicted Zn-dependent protease
VNDTVPLHAHLLGRGELLATMGRARAARVTLRRLLRQPEVPSASQAEANRVLGDLEFAAGRFRRARRYFAAAIGLRPYVAELYLRYAAAVEADPKANPRKGLAALRRAICVEPQEPGHWTARGRLALRAGDTKQARVAFRRAAGLRPETVTVLAEIVDGFVAMGREDEARRVLIAARFRAPNDAGIAQLWNQFRFDCLRLEQARSSRGARAGADTILPFPEPVASCSPVEGRSVVIRADRVSRPRPHVLRLFPVNRHGS